jgi:DNA-binding response OmpR family regulator
VAKVLIIEDDEFVAEELSNWLNKEHHTVDVSFAGADGLYRLQHYDYEIAVIDWNLPDIQGIDICMKVREIKPGLPLLMLTSRGNIADRIEGLDAGAFDYVVKPCALAELSARIRSLLRRNSPPSSRKIEFSDITLDPNTREVCCNKQELGLSATEFDILLILIERKDRELDYKELAREIGKVDDAGLRDRMKTHMKNLRQKLLQANSRALIEYRNQQGYLLVEENA